MVKVWVGELMTDQVDVSVQVGEDAPESEQEWANAILGLPADFQVGDQFPATLQAEIDAIREQNEAASAKSVVVPETQSGAKNWAEEPKRGTQAWIDFMEAEPNPNQWNWPAYLVALRQEARDGHESAKQEIEAFRANGVQISGGCQVKPEPGSRNQANKQRREERRARRQANYLTKKVNSQPAQRHQPAPHQNSGGSVRVARISVADDVFNLPGVKVTAKSEVIKAAKQVRYDRVMAVFWDEVPGYVANVQSVLDRLAAEGKQGKVRRFQTAFDVLKKWIVTDAPTIEDFFSRPYMLRYREYHRNCKQDFINEFYTTPEQQEESNPDSQFYRACINVFDALYLAMMVIELTDEKVSGVIAHDQTR